MYEKTFYHRQRQYMQQFRKDNSCGFTAEISYTSLQRTTDSEKKLKRMPIMRNLQSLAHRAMVPGNGELLHSQKQSCTLPLLTIRLPSPGGTRMPGDLSMQAMGM